MGQPGRGSIGPHLAGTYGEKLGQGCLHRFEGASLGQETQEKSGGRRLGAIPVAAWGGELELQPIKSWKVGQAAPLASGQCFLGNPGHLGSLIPCFGWRELCLQEAALSGHVQHDPSAPLKGFGVFFPARWIGSESDLVLNCESRLLGPQFRVVGPSPPWHTLPLSDHPLCLPRGGRSARVRVLTAPAWGSVGCG